MTHHSIDIRRFDLPGAFIRQLKPVTVARAERGLFRYLFDHKQLEFFRGMTTADCVPYNAVWTVVASPDNDPLRIIAGEHGEGIGYVVTNVPRTIETPRDWVLSRLLTYRQRVQIAVLNKLMGDLESSSLNVPRDVMQFLRATRKRCLLQAQGNTDEPTVSPYLLSPD